MAPGDSAGMLGGWAGTDYAHTSSLTGVSNTARAYRNRADAIMTPFAIGASFGATEEHFDVAYTRASRTLNFNINEDGSPLPTPAPSFDIAGDMFPTAGSTTYTQADTEVGVVQSVVIPGTYQGALGDYYCSGPNCMATVTASGATELAGRWRFKHDEGAMITSPDPNFLYFGWWLQQDGTGTPARASAFTGFVSPDGANPFQVSDVSATGVRGSATYAGHAAGKFAISNPIGDDDAGHFTADAMLSATFGPNDAPNFGGVTGTLDNFMANEEAVDWEVTLLRTEWVTYVGTDDGTIAATAGRTQMPFDDPNTGGVNEGDVAATTNIDESEVGTIWSIDGNAAAASGSWSAQMYDETTGSAGDGNTVPTSVTGTFQSHFGAIHTMVGAFGAERTE